MTRHAALYDLLFSGASVAPRTVSNTATKLPLAVEEFKTNLMSLVTLFHSLCTQHVSDINISIIRSLRLCCWITTLVVSFCEDGGFSVGVNLWCLVVCVWCDVHCRFFCSWLAYFYWYWPLFLCFVIIVFSCA